MMSERRILLVISSVFLTPVLFTGLVILLAQVCGCVYDSAPIYQSTLEENAENSIRYRYPHAAFSENENAWRWKFTVVRQRFRSGVYKDPPQYTPGGAHWGQAGAFLEGVCQLLFHFPTIPAERIMYSSEYATFDYVLLDHNSNRAKVEEKLIPGYSIQCQEFKDYRTNSVLHLDYARWEELARKDEMDRKGERPWVLDEKMEYYRLLDSIGDWRPVLWWRDSFGVENMIWLRSVYKGERYVSWRDQSHGRAQAYQLYYFKDARFVRIYEFERRPEGMAENDRSFDRLESYFLFNTIDGRHVNIASRVQRGGSPCVDWMFRQIDLETGADRKVGSYSAMSKDCVDDGLELRVLGVRSRKGDY